MASNIESKFGERAARFGRDFNTVIALGAGAIALAIPGPNVLISSYAAFNAAQAGGFELLRRWAKKKKT
ncbi:hypothetical protein H0V99_02890 [Candidatus Saccharibacteria bacterium]|nr:hypothetical protein [Candidatus Saccharibacteria bacterium]